MERMRRGRRRTEEVERGDENGGERERERETSLVQPILDSVHTTTTTTTTTLCFMHSSLFCNCNCPISLFYSTFLLVTPYYYFVLMQNVK